MGFHHVGQAGLELLTSGDLSALVSQNAGITGVNHCTGLFISPSRNLDTLPLVVSGNFFFETESHSVA